MTGTEEPAQGQMSPETAVRLWISGYFEVTIGSMLPQPNAGVQRSSTRKKRGFQDDIARWFSAQTITLPLAWRPKRGSCGTLN
jgi:hypothetical protein